MATACRYQAGPQTILACRTTKGAIGSQLKIAAYTSIPQSLTTLVQFLLAAVAPPENGAMFRMASITFQSAIGMPWDQQCNTNIAHIGYDKIFGYSGIEHNRIKTGISFLASIGLRRSAFLCRQGDAS
jgi:hypothetical protein